MNFSYHWSSSAQQNFRDHFVATIISRKALFIATASDVCVRPEERQSVDGEMEMYISGVEWKYTQCKQVCVSVFVVHATHMQRQFLCTVLYNSPLPSQPHNAGPSPRRRDYPLPCLSEAGRGSQHGASQPALPGPAPTASQALLFRLAQRGLSYWTRGQFITATLPRQNDFSQCFGDSQSQGPNEVKWMPVRPRLHKQLSSWKQHPSPASRRGQLPKYIYSSTIFPYHFCTLSISILCNFYSFELKLVF